MQTILGAGGAIGNALAKALTAFTNDIRLVSRTPEKINATDQLFPADLTNYKEVHRAVEGSEVVYLTVGLPYATKTWQQTWPVIMDNVVDACAAHHCRLVFFDNLYLYDGSNLSNIRETNPINPPSEKGKIRAAILETFWKAVQQKGLMGLVARSADFYGPSLKNVGMLTETVFTPLSQGKTANLMVSDQYRHSYTYTIDAAKATALLGNTIDAYGDTWHLPTASNPYTGKQWVELIARELGVKPKYRVVSKTLVKLIGIFVPVMRESHEMLYQYDKDYVFNSEKFEQRFSFTPTAYVDGVREIITADYRK